MVKLKILCLKNLGKKAEAKIILDSFVSSFETLEQKRSWVMPFLEQRKYRHRIRHEIYEHLVYPVLLDGYLKNDVLSVTWLARTASNLHAVKSPNPLLKHKTEFTLFKESYSLEADETVREDLLNTLINWFGYSQHEWPTGILYGTDGADIEQCEDILQEIGFARSIDHQRKYDLYLSEFEVKVHDYISRIRECDS